MFFQLFHAPSQTGRMILQSRRLRVSLSLVVLGATGLIWLFSVTNAPALAARAKSQPLAPAMNPGDLDATFDGDGRVATDFSGRDDEIKAIAIQPDGKIVAAGYTTTPNNQIFAATRYNPDGSLDTSFGTGGKASFEFSSRSSGAYDVALQSDGKIVLAGFANITLPFPDAVVVRLNTDGTLDNDFGTAGKVIFDFSNNTDAANAVEVQSDNKIVIASTALVSGMNNNFALARFNPNGTIDTTFGNNGKVFTDFANQSDMVKDIALQPDGKIVAAGQATLSLPSGPATDFALARYNPDGSLDTTFDGDGRATTDISGQAEGIDTLLLSDDGKILTAGLFGFSAGVVRFQADGSLDTGFGLNGKVQLNLSPTVAKKLVRTNDGKIVVGGSFSTARFALARLNDDGTFDRSFGTNGQVITSFPNSDSAEAFALAAQANGRLLLAGRVRDSNTGYNFALARYFNTTACTYAVNYDRLGAIAAGGSYTANITAQDGCAWTATSNNSFLTVSNGSGIGNGTVTFSVSPNTAATNRTGTLTIAGQTLTVVQDASNVNPTNTGQLDYAFDFDGLVTTNFLNNSNDSGRTLARQADGKLILAGGVANPGNSAFGLARYRPDGTLDTSFGNQGKVVTFFSSFGSLIYALALQPDGKIIAGGFVANDNISSTRDFALARYLPDGSLDNSFGTGGKVRLSVRDNGLESLYALALQSDGKIIAAGNYDNAGNFDFITLRLNPDGTPDSTFGNNGRSTFDNGNSRDFPYTAIVLSDNKIMIIGTAYAGGSNPDTAVVLRYLPDGTPDLSFGDQGRALTRNTTATAAALRPDNKLVVAGNGRLLRYTENGLPDGSFGYNGRANLPSLLNSSSSTTTYSIALAADGKIAVTGDNSDNNFVLALLQPDGVPDTGFGVNGVVNLDFAGGRDIAYGLVIQPDGHFVLGGTASFNSNNDFALARILGGATCSYTVTPPSRLLPAESGTGAFNVIAGQGCAWTAASNVNFITITSGANGTGTGTVNFSVSANTTAFSRTGTLTIASQPVTVTQAAVNNPPVTAPGNFDTGFDNDGRVTTTFFGGSTDQAWAVATQFDDKIIVAGSTAYDGLTDFGLARYQANGALDTNFGNGGKVITDFAGSADNGRAVEVQADGKILVAGSAQPTQAALRLDFAVARYLPDGRPDAGFGNGGKVTVDFGTANSTDEQANAVLLQPDGKIILAGYSSANFVTDFALARLNQDGTPDLTFGNGGRVLTDFNGNSDQIRTAQLQPDGKILVGGVATLTNGSNNFALARYNSDGTLDNSFGTGGKVVTTTASSVITGLAVLEDGKILVAGDTTFSNSGFLARYQANGALDTTFGNSGTITTSLANNIQALALQSDGKMVVCGSDNNNLFFNGGFRVARFNANGTPDTAFGSNGVNFFKFYGAASEACRALTLQTNDRIVVAGYADGPANSDFAVARLLNGASGGLTLAGRLTDARNALLRGVTLALSGTTSRTAQTDANGNYAFDGLPAGGTYTVKPLGPYYAFGPVRRDFVNLNESQTNINFTAADDVAPALPSLTDDFAASTRDAEKWSVGVLSRPADAADAGLNITQTNGQLVIAPRANVNSRHFNGYASVNHFDLTTGTAQVELVQAATNGAETTFALGGGPAFYFRFNVAPYHANAAPTITNAPLDTTAPLLVAQARVGARTFVKSVPYDPTAHRFLRLRHDNLGNVVIFEAGATAEGDYAEIARVGLGARYWTGLQVELSAGTTNPALTPGPAIFDNLTLTAPNPARFATPNLTVSENAGQAQFTVTRTGLAETPAVVEYATAGGTAQSGVRYLATSGQLAFAPGETDKTITVPLLDDQQINGTQTVELFLSNARGVSLDGPARAVLTITDNDTTPPTTNPLETPQFFVTQQYYDFLNRAPDAAGLDYWTGQITQCGADANCLRARRIGVSAAFFVELEFQETGYVVYRLYRAALGTQPAPNQTRANLLFNDFIRDRAQLVGGPGLLESTRQLAANFVGRSEFETLYGSELTPTQYVNQLFDRAGLSGAQFAAQRQAEINALTNEGRTRAQVLLNVIEIPAFKQREYNPAFVLMQYFGYLRRDPDQAGYDFWVDVITNREAGNVRGMVCAFLTSAEYQLRFGTQTPRSNTECSPSP